MKLSPTLAGLRTYPFVRLTEAKQRLAAAGVDFVDFGMGEPREETPAFIREALAAAIEPLSTYPVGRRPAGAARGDRRLGAAAASAWRSTPTARSSRRSAPRRRSSTSRRSPAASWSPRRRPPTPSTSAAPRSPGAELLELPLTAERGFLPDLDAVDAATWARVGVLWLNYPNNPTAATAPVEFYERAAALAREHDFVLASDEAYSELYFGDEPPASALQVADRTNVLVFNTLSKRSSMPGYRTGFAAGDPEVVAALKRYRPNVGVAPLEMVQRAAVAAWGDEAHVEEVRGRYRAKRDVLLPVLEAGGLRSRRRRRDVLPLARRRPGRRGARGAADRGRRDRHARLLLRRRGRGLPADGARAAAGRLRARGQPARASAVSGHGAAASS